MSKPAALEGLRRHPLLEQMTRRFRTRGAVCGLWNLKHEALSLGGLLLLRAELELLASACGLDRIALSFVPPLAAGRVLEPHSLVGEVFKSVHAVTFEEYRLGEAYWPDPGAMDEPNFSYQYFDRCAELHQLSGLRPSLTWDAETRRRALHARRTLNGQLYTAHLKQVPGANEEQSNANLAGWLDFLQAVARPGLTEFLLLGSDPLPGSFEELPGVHLAQKGGMSLPVQLAVVPMSSGFLGMASGVCAAAILSDVPYAVFKHPRHHVEEMNRQIGQGDALPFATQGQRILRERDTAAALARSYDCMRHSAL